LAVVNGRILWVGGQDEVTAILGDQPFTIDRRFADHVIVPGFVAQHDHPVLAALTMSSEILSIEEWALPGGTVPAVKDKKDFMGRLGKAVAALNDKDQSLLTWGYHPAFYGPLTKAELDGISTTNPIIVWGRSCHEMFFNSATMERAGLTEAVAAAFPGSAREQSNFADGRFWEQGMFAVPPKVASFAASPERLRAGLELSRDYMHSKRITIGNEPGGILSKPVQDGVNAVFASPDMPFRWAFMVDGKSMVAASADDQQVIAETGKLASWYGGMTSLAPRQAKLFADGAISSQAMQVREPYLDGHKGEWMMDEDVFNRSIRV
jgi:predicted amidohydrolase YtcJ